MSGVMCHINEAYPVFLYQIKVKQIKYNCESHNVRISLFAIITDNMISLTELLDCEIPVLNQLVKE